MPSYNVERQYALYQLPIKYLKNVMMNIKAFQFSQEKKALLSLSVHRIHMVKECQILVSWDSQILKTFDHFKFLIENWFW